MGYPTGASSAGPAPGPAAPPGPTPPPGPSPAPGSPHYEDPAGGCLSDEKAIRVQGLSGSFCSPRCTKMKCPQDVPEHVSAEPTCLLQDPSGEKFCALKCSKGGCGSATCHKIRVSGSVHMEAACLATPPWWTWRRR